jgi:CheY-like chemotaxis protein
VLGQASIFLVEDEVLIRMMLADMVEELGHRVVAEAGNVQDARALAETILADRDDGADLEFARALRRPF